MNRYLIGFILTVFMTSCNRDNCSKNVGFKVDYHLFSKINIDGDTYCNLVNKALKGDVDPIRQLSKIKVYDGASYQHGAILIEVIDKISEQEYLNIIQILNNKEKKHIYYSVLAAGLEYTSNPKYMGKSIENAFPMFSRKMK
ncbi:hypothetical protein BH20BAC1_BH20BAC1_01240 [soil metagenome]